MADITGYWFFSCSPSIWEVDLFLKTNPEYGKYTINKNHRDKIWPGQLGVIRVGTDRRSKHKLQGRDKLHPGVYAIVEILDFPIWSIDEDDEFYVDKTLNKKERFRVKIRYLKNLINNPLLIRTMETNPTINQDTLFIHGFQSATWPLTKNAFNEIINTIGIRNQVLVNVENENANTDQAITDLELKYQNAVPEIKEIISKRIERGKVASEIKKINSYKCQVCEAFGQNPYSFKKSDGEYYIETHHINPVSNLAQGSLGISNLITVCANHHRQFHYGENILENNAKDHLVIKISGESRRIEKAIY